MNYYYPNLFLIGGMRCGSTALHLLLEQHDEINMSSRKEPYYFNAELKRQKLYNKYCKELEEDLNSYVKKGKYRTTDKYISLFDNSRNYKYRGESSHYIYSPDTATIIKKKSPQSKIIISVRNPIDRMYSEYLYHSRIEGQSKLDFGSYVNDNLKLFKLGMPTRLTKGLYNDSIFHWIKIFGEDNVKIIIYEEFEKDQQKVLSEIYNWLNLLPSKINNLTPQKTGKIRFVKLFYFINSSTFIKSSLKIVLSKKNRIKFRSFFYSILIRKKKKSDISISVKKQLLDLYRDDIFALGKLLKKDMSFWLEI
jgi:hypothetical protein